MCKDTITLEIFKKNVNNLYQKDDDYSVLEYFEHMNNSLENVIYAFFSQVSELSSSIKSNEEMKNILEATENCFYLMRFRKLLIETVEKANLELEAINDIELN